MTTYIAGYDGSDASRQAVRFAVQLAAAEGATVVAAGVHRGPRHVFGVGAAREAEEALADEARAATLDLLSAVEAEGVELAAVAADSAAEGLHRLAEERDAALVVVGSTHRGAAGRLVPGSVGEQLVHGAPCPVAVVPAEREARPVETIGVAFDGRPESRRAVRAAEQLAAALDARLLLLAVYEPVMASHVAPGVPVSSLDYDAQMRRELEVTAQAMTDELPEARRLPPLVLTGPAGPTLVAAAGREGLDLLVTGSRGYGPVRSVLVGSVSRHLVDHAPCPVVVVPRAVAVPAAVA